MSAHVQQIGVLIAFVALMLVVNVKAGGSWSGRLLKWATYLLLVAGVGALVFKVAGFVL